MRILHFNIKPNNILLDKNFNPKISDFGLAKLCLKTHSIVTMLDVRGTIGYIAPEVWNRHFGGASHKSDVYSYEMMILEMMGGKHNNTNAEVTSHSSELYFPHWIYKHIESDKSSVAWQGASMSNEEVWRLDQLSFVLRVVEGLKMELPSNVENVHTEREDPSQFITHRAKDFVISTKEIEHRFFRAFESGREVSRLLEANKIMVGYSESKGKPSAMALLRAFCSVFHGGKVRPLSKGKFFFHFCEL
ncbi:hypothetical protein AHAS_Ahas05G0225200 [Arachis hypogaea]